MQLYSAALDSQALQSCLDDIARTYPDLKPEIFSGLVAKVNAVAATLSTFIQLVNDIDKTIERNCPMNLL